MCVLTKYNIVILNFTFLQSWKIARAIEITNEKNES